MCINVRRCHPPFNTAIPQTLKILAGEHGMYGDKHLGRSVFAPDRWNRGLHLDERGPNALNRGGEPRPNRVMQRYGTMPHAIEPHTTPVVKVADISRRWFRPEFGVIRRDRNPGVWPWRCRSTVFGPDMHGTRLSMPCLVALHHAGGIGPLHLVCRHGQADRDGWYCQACR